MFKTEYTVAKVFFFKKDSVYIKGTLSCEMDMGVASIDRSKLSLSAIL
jgi:hypothetical protein